MGIGRIMAAWQIVEHDGHALGILRPPSDRSSRRS
jgi:hypothetical protein